MREYLPSCPSNRCVDTSFCYRKHEQFKEKLLWPAHQRSEAHHINFPCSCCQWWLGKPIPFTRDLPPFSQWSGTIPTASHYPGWTVDYPYLLMIAMLPLSNAVQEHTQGVVMICLATHIPRSGDIRVEPVCTCINFFFQYTHMSPIYTHAFNLSVKIRKERKRHFVCMLALLTNQSRSLLATMPSALNQDWHLLKPCVLLRIYGIYTGKQKCKYIYIYGTINKPTDANGLFNK